MRAARSKTITNTDMRATRATSKHAVCQSWSLKETRAGSFVSFTVRVFHFVGSVLSNYRKCQLALAQRDLCVVCIHDSCVHACVLLQVHGVVCCMLC